MPGENGRSLVIPEAGSYEVIVTNSFGCSAMSDPYVVHVLDIEDRTLPEGWRISVFPDPARDVATLQIDVPMNEEAGVWLMDVLGRRRHVTDIPHGANSVELRLDLTSIPVGMYHVVVQTASHTVTRKFMRR
jgi:hypothetical protein